MNSRERWARILAVVGYILMLVGAIDPMEGSLIILPGSGLVAVGALISRDEGRHIAHRMWVFLLIAVGVGALWGLSQVGGLGGKSGHSLWWGVLIVPYLVGWSLGIWGPAAPRWVPMGGIVISLLYLAIPVLVLMQARANPARPVVPAALIAIALLGLVTLAGCIFRLRRPAVDLKPKAASR